MLIEVYFLDDVGRSKQQQEHLQILPIQDTIYQ